MKIIDKNGKLEVETFVNIAVTITEDNGAKFDVESELPVDKEIMKKILELLDEGIYKAIHKKMQEYLNERNR